MASHSRLGDTQPATDASDVSGSSVSMTFEEIARTQRLLQSSYRRFFFYHVLSLVPTLSVLIAVLAGSLQVRELCHLQEATRDYSGLPSSLLSTLHSVYQKKGQCRSILDAQLLTSTLILGLVGWLASYTSRKVCLAFAERVIPRLFSSSLSIFSRTPRFQLRSQDHSTGKETIVITVAIALQALIAESLRMLSFYWACCILVTALYLYPIQERNSHRARIQSAGPDWAWRLSFRDPRFFVAAWSSLAWALAEFGFGAFQILHQVALYKPADVHVSDDVLPPSRAVGGQSGFSLLSGYPIIESDQAQTPERGNGKARRMSASGALEQARQRLIQPAGESATGTRQANYGAMEPLSEAVTDEEEGSSRASGSSFSETATTISLLDQELEEEAERFLVAKERFEVEAVLGVPLPEIPVALCALWRIDAMLWSVGSSLLLSASFTHAQGRLGHLSYDRFDLSPQFHLLPRFDGFGLTFVVLVLLHTVVSSLWATSLPSMGFATTTYASLLFGLAIMVAALARWGLLI
ncbi:uncharacterized protein UBRO_03132 [Ustilago bromivora]|uniref:Uncharacterized protein n=1 Tax=Ustilago bromivora TaxID=307758 RepID=A0A1K0HBV3_9BASI|nr:uncharacterized protein UBRO_03132 [Ustilago bromivora]SYW74991.1 uncharacterized protein UBRO2_00401 [Ustilago bromivora]